MAEIIATFLLVFVTCGSAALSASDERKISKLGASMTGGLIVTVMIYAVGHISGAHMNPAVTLAFATFRHFPWKQVNPSYLRTPHAAVPCINALTLEAMHINLESGLHFKSITRLLLPSECVLRFIHQSFFLVISGANLCISTTNRINISLIYSVCITAPH